MRVRMRFTMMRFCMLLSSVVPMAFLGMNLLGIWAVVS